MGIFEDISKFKYDPETKLRLNVLKVCATRAT